MDEILALIIWLCLIVAYWAPTAIAAIRSHPQVAAIAIVNFFLGWTFIGWVVALAWSLMATKEVRAA